MLYTASVAPTLVGTVALTFLVPSAVAGAQHGDSQALALTWRAPAECPSREAVESEVTRLVGGEPSSMRGAQLKATAYVVERPEEKAARRWVLTLRTELSNEHGERRLEGRSCWEVARAAALVLALTVNPDAALPAEGERNQRAGAVADDSASDADAHAPDPLSWSVEAQSLLGVGHLPGPALALGGAARVRWRRVGVAAFGHTWFERSADADGASNKGGDFWAVDGGAALELGIVTRRVLVDALGGVEFDYLRGHGWGVDVRSQASAVWIAPLVGGRLALPISRHVYGAVSAYAAFPSSRREFVLDEIGPVFRPAWLNGRLAFSLGWRT